MSAPACWRPSPAHADRAPGRPGDPRRSGGHGAADGQSARRTRRNQHLGGGAARENPWLRRLPATAAGPRGHRHRGPHPGARHRHRPRRHSAEGAAQAGRLRDRGSARHRRTRRRRDDGRGRRSAGAGTPGPADRYRRVRAGGDGHDAEADPHRPVVRRLYVGGRRARAGQPARRRRHHDRVLAFRGDRRRRRGGAPCRPRRLPRPSR